MKMAFDDECALLLLISMIFSALAASAAALLSDRIRGLHLCAPRVPKLLPGYGSFEVVEHKYVFSVLQLFVAAVVESAVVFVSSAPLYFFDTQFCRPSDKVYLPKKALTALVAKALASH